MLPLWLNDDENASLNKYVAKVYTISDCMYCVVLCHQGSDAVAAADPRPSVPVVAGEGAV